MKWLCGLIADGVDTTKLMVHFNQAKDKIAWLEKDKIKRKEEHSKAVQRYKSLLKEARDKLK